MRSYEAARSVFGILEIVSWIVIAIGGLIAFVALIALDEMGSSFGGSPIVGLAGIVPGLVIMFAGLLGLVAVQIGRAGVDTAEYTQQMLKIARDQLEVSQQALRGHETPANSFADAVAKAAGASSTTYDILGNTTGKAEPADTAIPALEDAVEPKASLPDEARQNDTAFQIGRQVVQTVHAAKQGLVATVNPAEGDVPLEWKTEKRPD